MQDNTLDKVKQAIQDINPYDIQQDIIKRSGKKQKPTIKQVEFTKQAMLTNAKQAYKQVYSDNPNNAVVEVNASVLSHNNKVIISREAILQRIADIVPDAVDRLHALINQSDNLLVARQASDSILDRAGYAPVHRSEVASISVTQGQMERLLQFLGDK